MTTIKKLYCGKTRSLFQRNISAHYYQSLHHYGLHRHNMYRCRNDHGRQRSTKIFSFSSFSKRNNKNSNHRRRRQQQQMKNELPPQQQQQQQQLEPHLTRKNKFDLFVLAAGVVFIGGYYLTSNNWDDDVRSVKTKLLSLSLPLSSKQQLRSIVARTEPVARPPLLIQRYTEHIMASSSLSSSSTVATLVQSGEFWASRQWFPFTSDLLITVGEDDSKNNSNSNSNKNKNRNHFGFVWDAKTTIFNLSHRILQSYIHSDSGWNSSTNKSDGDTDGVDMAVVDSDVVVEEKENIITKLWGIYPFCLQFEDDDPHILFWLAMAVPLFPQHIFENAVRWNYSTSAMSSSNDGDYFRLISNNRLHGGGDIDGDDRTRTQSINAELVVHDNRSFHVEFIFGYENKNDIQNDLLLLKSIKVMEDCDNNNNDQQVWQVFYKDYRYVPITIKNPITASTKTHNTDDDDDDDDDDDTDDREKESNDEEQQNRTQSFRQEQHQKVSSSSVQLVPTTIEIGKTHKLYHNNNILAYSSSPPLSSPSFEPHFKIHLHDIKYSS